MYWLLLPIEPNARRHFSDGTEPSGGFLVRLWAGLRSALTGRKSRRI